MAWILLSRHVYNNLVPKLIFWKDAIHQTPKFITNLTDSSSVNFGFDYFSNLHECPD